MFSGPRWHHETYETHITLSWGQAGEIDAALREASPGGWISVTFFVTRFDQKQG